MAWWRPVGIALGVVVLVLVALVLAIPYYDGIQQRARIAKAHKDVEAIARAVIAYASHVGRLPSTLSDLEIEIKNETGAIGGPFLRTTPQPPSGWTAEYSFTPGSDGMFTVSATGDGTTAQIPRP